VLPLNLSQLFLFDLLNPGALIPGALGFLDGAGASSLALTLPAGLDPGLAGATFHHAFVLLGIPDFLASYVSNAAELVLVP
jgi:hypothetical protein